MVDEAFYQFVVRIAVQQNLVPVLLVEVVGSLDGGVLLA